VKDIKGFYFFVFKKAKETLQNIIYQIKDIFRELKSPAYTHAPITNYRS